VVDLLSPPTTDRGAAVQEYLQQGTMRASWMRMPG
jgi:hypothetical protein